jgi:hypothetical protein
VEKTIYVPTYVTETRRVVETQYAQETRERSYTVYRSVPETKPVTREYTVMVPETRTRTVNYTVLVPVTRQVTRTYTVNVPVWRSVEEQYQVSVPVWKDVQQTYTVMVPHQETRTGTRTVCRIVPTVETRTITKDCGQWVTDVRSPLPQPVQLVRGLRRLRLVRLRGRLCAGDAHGLQARLAAEHHQPGRAGHRASAPDVERELRIRRDG